jgi:Fe2+ or Zn2+ uptake regulation protein
MYVTRRNRPIIMRAVIARIADRAMTPSAILKEMRSEFPFLGATTLRAMLDSLETEHAITVVGLEKGGNKAVKIYKVRDKPPPPAKQSWITPLFTSITPL